MIDFRLTRLLRTPSSEIYLIWDSEEHRIGQAHLHYAHDSINLTMVLEMDIERTEEEALITTIDEDIASSYLPSFDREDMFVTVFRGQETSSFSYAAGVTEDDDDVDLDDDDDDDVRPL